MQVQVHVLSSLGLRVAEATGRCAGGRLERLLEARWLQCQAPEDTAQVPGEFTGRRQSVWSAKEPKGQPTNSLYL